jgi:hypothetical protein
VTEDEETQARLTPKKKRLGGIRFKEPTPIKRPVNKQLLAVPTEFDLIEKEANIP